MQHLMRQEREFDPLIHGHRREDRGDLIVEKLVDHLLLTVIQVGRTQSAHTGLRELGLELFEKAAILIARHAVDAGGDRVELLADRHPGRVGGRRFLMLDQLQSADTNHEEFVEIARTDRQEFQAFQAAGRWGRALRRARPG